MQWKTRPYIYTHTHTCIYIHIHMWMINHNFMHYNSLYTVPGGVHCGMDPAFMVPVTVSGTPTFASSRGTGQSGTFCSISGSQECGSSRLSPKNKGVLSLQLFPVLNCPVYCLLPLHLSSLLLGQHFLSSELAFLALFCAFSMPRIFVHLPCSSLSLVHLYKEYWLLSKLLINQCVPAHTGENIYQICRHWYQWIHLLFVPHYCRSFTDWHFNEHWSC